MRWRQSVIGFKLLDARIAPGTDREPDLTQTESLAMIHHDRRLLNFLLLPLALAACADSSPTSSPPPALSLDLAARDAVRAYVTHVLVDAVSVVDVALLADLDG